MVNKQGLWFITLFSLIIILGIYYVSIPNDMIVSLIENEENAEIEIESVDSLSAIKVENEELMLKEIEDAKGIILDLSSSIEEKNNAYETLKAINDKKSMQEKIETLIKDEYSLNSSVQIKGSKINITLDSKDQGPTFANNVINSVQKLYKEKMYITIKFN